MPYVNNKGADQPAHPRSLINTFVFRFLDSMISTFAKSNISKPYLVSVAEQAGLSPSWSAKLPKTCFLVTYITETSPYLFGNFRKLSLYNCFMSNLLIRF